MNLEGHYTYKKLLKFTIPTMIMMICISLYTVVDGLFVSNVAGNTAFSALNFAYPVIALPAVFGLLFGTGGAALTSKYFGEGNIKKGNQIFSMLFYIMLILSLILLCIFFFLMKPILSLLGANEDILPLATTYGKIMILGLPFLMSMYFFQSYMIVAGKPNLSFIFSIFSGLVNVLGDFLLIYVFKFGIKGAAIATVASESLGLILPVLYLLSKKAKTDLRFTKFVFNKKDFIISSTNGLSEMISNLASSLVAIIFNAQLIKYFGDNGVSAYGTIQYVGFVFTGIYYGFASGISTLIAYNYGKDDKFELKSLFKKSITLYLIFQIVLATLTILSSNFVSIAFSNNNTELKNLTSRAIKLYATSYYLSGFNLFASALFTSYNNGLISGLLSILRTFIFQIATIFLSIAILGYNYIWLSVLFSEVLSFILSSIFVIKYGKKYGYLMTNFELNSYYKNKQA